MNNTIFIKGISKQFNGIWVLKDIDAIIHENRITAFVGPNGAGKTTLFNLITGELFADKGKIILGEKEITKLPPHKIARLGIGRQFQDVRIFENISVIDNVVVSLIGKKGIRFIDFFKPLQTNNKYYIQAKEYIDFVGLNKLSRSLAVDLSFGQQKLLSFARLMAADFSVLLLDEPIAGVSYDMITKIIDILRYMVTVQKKTIALIEHNMEIVADISNWVYFMNEGRIEFTGRTDHVLGNSEVKKLYMGV